MLRKEEFQGQEEERGILWKEKGKMSKKNQKAVLAVSFGSSYQETCASTIAVIEQAIRDANPECLVFRAWTSEVIRKKIRQRDGIHIYSVNEAMDEIVGQGRKEVIVQPVFVLKGMEYDLLVQEVQQAGKRLQLQIRIAEPLLASGQDKKNVLDALKQEWTLEEGQMLVLMGHGTKHSQNRVYEELNQLLKGSGCSNMVIGTMEAEPDLEEVLAAVNQKRPAKVVLAPFMIVAGAHAKKALAGDQEESWKHIFEQEGYEVECVLKGLGEYDGIRRIFLEHLEAVLEHT